MDNSKGEEIRNISLKIDIENTDTIEVEVNETTTVRDVKSHVELEVGVPSDLIQLELQKVALSENSMVLWDLGITRNDTFKVKLNPLWETFLSACLRLDNEEVKARIKFNTRELSTEDKLFVASFVAARKANSKLLFGILVEKRLDIQRKTCPCGRNLLHMAVASGCVNTVANVLMHKGGVLVDMVDAFGKTPLGMALNDNSNNNIINMLSGYRMLRLKQFFDSVDSAAEQDTVPLDEEHEKNSLNLATSCVRVCPSNLSVDSFKKMIELQGSTERRTNHVIKGSGQHCDNSRALESKRFSEGSHSNHEEEEKKIIHSEAELKDKTSNKDNAVLDLKENTDVMNFNIQEEDESVAANSSEHNELSKIGNSSDATNFNRNIISKEHSRNIAERESEDICLLDANTTSKSVENFNEYSTNNPEKDVMKVDSLSKLDNLYLERADDVFSRSSEDVSKNDDEGFGTEVHSSCDSTIFCEEEINIGIAQEEITSCQYSGLNEGTINLTQTSKEILHDAGVMLENIKTNSEEYYVEENIQNATKDNMENKELKSVNKGEGNLIEVTHPRHPKIDDLEDNMVALPVADDNVLPFTNECQMRRNDTIASKRYIVREISKTSGEICKMYGREKAGTFMEESDIKTALDSCQNEMKEGDKTAAASDSCDNSDVAAEGSTLGEAFAEVDSKQRVTSPANLRGPAEEVPIPRKIYTSRTSKSHSFDVDGCRGMSRSVERNGENIVYSSSAPSTTDRQGNLLFRRRERPKVERSRFDKRSLSISSVSSSNEHNVDGNVFSELVTPLDLPDKIHGSMENLKNNQATFPRIRKKGIQISNYANKCGGERGETNVQETPGERVIAPRPPKGPPRNGRTSRTRRPLSIGGTGEDKDKITESLRRNSSEDKPSRQQSKEERPLIPVPTPPGRKLSAPRYMNRTDAYRRRSVTNMNEQQVETQRPQTSQRPRSNSSPPTPYHLGKSPCARPRHLSCSSSEEDRGECTDDSSALSGERRARKVSFDFSSVNSTPKTRRHSEFTRRSLTFDEWLLEKKDQLAREKEKLETSSSEGSKATTRRVSKTISFEQWRELKAAEESREIIHPGYGEITQATEPRYQDPAPYRTWLQKKDDEALERERKLLQQAKARKEFAKKRQDNDLQRLLRKLSRDERVRKSSMQF